MNRKQAISFIKFQLDIYERLPYKKKLGTLIGTLKLSLSALKDQEERENQKRLTIDELIERDDPVWVSCKTLEGTDGYWCLCNKGVIVCPSGLCFDVRDIPHWIFFGNRPKEG